MDLATGSASWRRGESGAMIQAVGGPCFDERVEARPDGLFRPERAPSPIDRQAKRRPISERSVSAIASNAVVRGTGSRPGIAAADLRRRARRTGLLACRTRKSLCRRSVISPVPRPMAVSCAGEAHQAAAVAHHAHQAAHDARRRSGLSAAPRSPAVGFGFRAYRCSMSWTSAREPRFLKERQARG